MSPTTRDNRMTTDHRKFTGINNNDCAAENNHRRCHQIQQPSPPIPQTPPMPSTTTADAAHDNRLAPPTTNDAANDNRLAPPTTTIADAADNILITTNAAADYKNLRRHLPTSSSLALTPPSTLRGH